jgi:hypothetical protein
MLKNLKLLISSLAFILAQDAFAQSFENVSAQHGIDASLTLSTQGSGVSFYDFDNDGWDDLSFAQVNSPPRFFRNNQGNFEEVELSIGNDALMKHLTWVDIDNDGDADLFYTAIFGACRLFINEGDLTFTDASEGSGFPADSTHHVDGVCWGDYDRDGFVDAYLCHFNDQYYPHQYTNWLMRNLGDGTFENVTETAGVGNGYARSFQASFLDFDGDSWPDIHVINDRPMYADALYRNLGDGTFEDVSVSSNTGISIDAMSTSCADYDNDEDLDIYVTNLPSGNVLLNNDQGVFADSTSAAGLEVFGVCWAANWADFDNDGWQDLYVCTMDAGDTESYNYAYENNGSGMFSDIGFGSFPDDEFQSWSNVSGDINNDGYVDLASSAMSPQLPPLWLNDASASNNFVKIGLEGTASNRDGIGSWIKIYTGDIIQTRYTACGEDYLCQDSQREIIGLGQSEIIDSLTVQWPSGHSDKWYDIPANETLQLVEGSSISESTCPGDFTGDNIIDVSDLLIFLTGFGCLADCATDLDGDGMASTSDLIQFLAYFGMTCTP